MSLQYGARKELGGLFSGRARPESYKKIGILTFLAALPLTLGLLMEAGFSNSAQTGAGQNAAAIAQPSGNQPSNPALAIGANAVRGAQGEVLALCSGLSGARPGARPDCNSLGLIIQR